MEMTLEDIRFVTVASARNQTEAIHYRLLLDRTMIPYRVVNENPALMIQSTGFGFLSRIEFQVQSQDVAAAAERLGELFEIHGEKIPEKCPACDSPTRKGKLECPSCGLFLC
jgi:hypothetical protein